MINDLKWKHLKLVGLLSIGTFWLMVISGMYLETALMFHGAFWLMFWSVLVLASPFMPADQDEKRKNDHAAGES